MRRPISDPQRKALRAWYFGQNPRPSQKACISWFDEQYDHKISQSTVSDSLGDRYKHLDTDAEPPSSSRNRATWPELETILAEWQRVTDSRGEPTSGDILIDKAREIWKSLPQYKDHPVPNFSAGWLHRFKRRYGIGRRHQSAESAEGMSAGRAHSGEELSAIRTLSGHYAEDDIYNMDEAGLFWRLAPSSSLAPTARFDKQRISLVCCVNASGTDRLPVWFIGNTRAPRSLGNVNLSAMGCQWRHNNKAGMTQIIMKEWLLAFYSHVGSRVVLLALDNLSAHLGGLELAPPPPNVRIQWLPTNSTSRFQPIEQGISYHLKIYYRRQWLQYMLDAFMNNTNPLETVTVLDAVRWVLRAWNHDILSSTINSCFRNSTLVFDPIRLPIESPDLSELYSRVQQAGSIHEPMSLADFLNPADESDDIERTDEIPSQDELLQQLIFGRLEPESMETARNADAEDAAPPRIPKLSEALQAVELLIAHAEGQEDTNTGSLRQLEQYERYLRRKLQSIAAQVVLEE